MRPQVETNLSNPASDSSILGLGLLSSTDIIAIVAVVVSIFTWFRSRAIEDRIRADSDERAKFDIVLGNPLTSRLEPLENILAAFGRAVLEGRSTTATGVAISQIQKYEHADWYFGVMSVFDAHDEMPCGILRTELDSYWDQASFLIDEIINATTSERAATLVRQLRLLGEGYLGRSRRILVDHRIKVRGHRPPVLRIPKFRSST